MIKKEGYIDIFVKKVFVLNLCEMHSHINARILWRTSHQLVATSVRGNQLGNNALESHFGQTPLLVMMPYIRSLLVYSYSKIFTRFCYIQRNQKSLTF